MLRFRSAVSVASERSGDERTNGATWLPKTPAPEAHPADAHAPGEFSLPQPEVIRNLVERVERGDTTAKYRLYEIFNRGIRFQLLRHLGTADLDDKVHDTFVIVLQAIVRINRELGTTAAVITHNAAIADMADRVVYLGDGRIQKVIVNTARKTPSELSW